jgi:Tol biopolymer transport system component/serine/threonine protein kinase
MTPERWNQVEEIFNAALDRPAEERAAFLNAACGADLGLREQVEYLLDCHYRAGAFIETPAAESMLSNQAVRLQSDAMIGHRIGAYRLVREIGRGGMGAVYLAVRADNQFNQRAAIKLVKRGMDTDFILRRFRNERQILAALNHPHIARLLDGGTTDDGLPYFVMEYIEGLPIHRYCNLHRLTVTERLQMFRQVCAAVAHAHAHQVIHRDIKPGNILVTDDGTPKLLDFGIAKILDPELAWDSLDPTAPAMRMMTPDYASPEQARGEPVTDATDQYSLGVLLYELLTGQRPHHLRRHSPHEIARIISEEAPPRPSELVARTREVTTGDGQRTITLTPETVSSERNCSPDELHSALAGRLDNIVMRALSKDPQRRYGSVQELSADIERYLQGQPVVASACVNNLEEETEAEAIPTETDCLRDEPAPANKRGIRRRTVWKVAVGAEALLVAIPLAFVSFVGVTTAIDYFLADKPDAPSRQVPHPSSFNTPRRLTSILANDTHPRVSPDGTQIVFVSDRSGSAELYVMNLDGSGLRNLTSDAAHETSPAWSPDGQRIAFGIQTVALRESDIWMMNVESGKPARLMNAPGYDARPAFSPDSSRIVFASNRGARDHYNFDLWMMNADGSEPRRLTDYAEFDSDPVWSPDGKRIAFTRTMPDRQFDILIINADGTSLVNLTSTEKFDEATPAWSPDGRRIAFASNRGSQNANYDIWVMNADGSVLRQLTFSAGHNTEPAWTPDGRRLVFQSTRDFNPEIYIMEIEPGIP